MDHKLEIYALIINGFAVIAAVWAVIETRNASKREIGVKTWLALIKRFDSDEMKLARKQLAHNLDPYRSEKHDAIKETVIDFFEDIGTLYKERYLDRKLARSSFSYYANHWWESAKAYIDAERKNKGDDESLFEDFQILRKEWKSDDPRIDSDAVKAFLADEKNLQMHRAGFEGRSGSPGVSGRGGA
jgi:hypothetical protein